MSSPGGLSFDYEEKQLAKCKSIIQPMLDNMDTSFYDLPAAYGLKKLQTDITPQLTEVDLRASPVSPNEYYRKGNGRHITSHCQLKDVMNNFDRGPLVFVGPPGSGKTTLMKSITRNIMGGQYEKLKEVTCVFLYQGREFVNEKETSPAEVLGIEYQVLKLIKRFPRRFLFVIDALDTLPFTLVETKRSIGLETITSTSAIMHELISGKLFPRCRVIASLREYSPHMKHAKMFISLEGLSDSGIHKFIYGYLPLERGKKMMDFLHTKSPSLVSVCRNPLFLAFLIIGFENASSFHPNTMTGILVLLLQSFVRSEHARRENIEDIIHKLKKVAFNCLDKRRVTFSRPELNVVQLSPEDITDLTALLLPCSINHHESNNVEYTFCHQLIQETLSAMYIAEMDLNEFTSFVSKSVLDPQYVMVWRILSGIMLDNEIEKQATGLTKVYDQIDFKGKQKVLGNIFKQRVSAMEAHSADALPNLYLSLFEAKDGVKDTILDMRTLAMSGLTPFHILLPEEACAIGTIAANCEKLEELQLQVLNLNPRTLSILDECLKNSHTKISRLDLSGNFGIAPQGMAHVSNIIRSCHVKTLILHGCLLCAPVLQSLEKSLKMTLIESLFWSSTFTLNLLLKNEKALLLGQSQWSFNLDHNLDEAEVMALCRLFPNITKELQLQWTMDDEGGKLMQKRLDELPGSCLQIALVHQENGEPKITTLSKKDQAPPNPGIEVAPEFLTVPQTKGLNQKLETATTAEDFLAICEQHGEASSMFDGVELSHKGLTANILESLCIVLPQISPVKLELRDCNLNASFLKALRKFCSEHKLRIPRLTVSSTTKFGDVVDELCKFIDEAKVGHLCIEENDLCNDHLVDISRLIKDSQLRGLDLSYNKQMTDFSSIGRISKTHSLKELRLVNCDLTDDHIERLSEAIGVEATLSVLDVSHNLELSVKSFALLPKLMTSKINCLNISDCDMTEDEIDALKEALSNRMVTELNISNNEELDVEGMVVLAHLIRTSCVRRLSLAGCALNRERLKAFRDHVQGSQIEVLDVSDNMRIGDGIVVISDLVRQCSIQEVDISDCMLTSQQVTDFTRFMHSNTAMTHLNLSDSNRTVDKTYVTALCKLIPHVKDELTLCFSKLPRPCRDILQNQLDKSEKELKVKIRYGLMRDLRLDGLKIISNRQEEDILTTKRNNIPTGKS